MCPGVSDGSYGSWELVGEGGPRGGAGLDVAGSNSVALTPRPDSDTERVLPRPIK